MSNAILSLNLATTRRQWNLPEAVEACLRHGISAIAPWRDHVQAFGIAEASRIVKTSGLRVTSLCRGGMFTGESATARQAAIEDNLRAIDEAAALQADCLILVCGGLPPGSRDIAGARRMCEDGIAAILPHARAAGVPLAIEPLHPMYAADRSAFNTIDQVLELCARLGDGAGVIVDVYHTWWDPHLEASIARAGRDRRILGHHISDWLVPTRDLLLDRGMMGDGVIDFKTIRGWIEAAGYTGPQEVEIFSAADWWRRPGEEVLRTCLERFKTLC